MATRRWTKPVLHGQGDAVRLLLAHGADARRVHSESGRGPLHEASIKGFAALAQPLVDAGAGLAQKDRSGQTPLDLALAYKNGPMVAALLRLGSRLDNSAAAGEAMEMATLRGRTEIARLLIDNGFDVNQPTRAGSTYLNDAALKGQGKWSRYCWPRALVSTRAVKMATARCTMRRSGAALRSLHYCSTTAPQLMFPTVNRAPRR